MLLYITTGEPRDRKVNPLHTIPDTVNELFYLAMREHDRPAVVQYWQADRWMRDPDWRFDRQVIQVALFLTTRLDLSAGDGVGILGPLRPLWLQVDFAVQGFHGVPVGFADELTDDQLCTAVDQSGVRVIFATDRTSTERLVRLRPRFREQPVLIKAEGAEEGEDGIVGGAFLWSRGQVLDTPERAQSWRATARKVDADMIAGVHFGAVDKKVVREAYTHGDAMSFVRDRVERSPAASGDVAFFEAQRVTPIVRQIAYAYVGDGDTVVVLPGTRGAQALHEERPTRLVVSESWLAGFADDVEAKVGSRKLHDRLAEVVGERLRWIEPTSELPAALERRLLEAGLPLPALALQGKTPT